VKDDPDFPWDNNLRLDFDQSDGPDDPEDVEVASQARIDLAGLYRPCEDAKRDGANVGIAIGPYRIAYPLGSAKIDVECVASPDIRTVTVDDSLASICEWQKVGKKKKQDACVALGGIQLPFKGIFTRIPR